MPGARRTLSRPDSSSQQRVLLPNLGEREKRRRSRSPPLRPDKHGPGDVQLVADGAGRPRRGIGGGCSTGRARFAALPLLGFLVLSFLVLGVLALFVRGA